MFVCLFKPRFGKVIAFDVGERNPNLGLRVVNMGSLCFYMRAESRFFGVCWGLYQICAILNNYTMRAHYFLLNNWANEIFAGETRYMLARSQSRPSSIEVDAVVLFGNIISKVGAVDVIFVRLYN